MTNSFITAGVMGWPVAHSRSPAIHTHWIRQHGLHGSYGLFPVHPDNLRAALLGIRALGIAGCNVTIPHKVSAMAYMDHVDPLARKIGAINTVVVQADGALHGFNYDAFGYIESLREAQPLWQASTGPVTVLGAGGAARAIVVGLLESGAPEIRILNRTHAKAQELANEFGSKVAAYDWRERHGALGQCALLVNTTSLGMHGQEALDVSLSELPTSALVSDIIYIPGETQLLKQARQRGNVTVNGLGMLLHQARPAFHAWFGVMPEVTPSLRASIEVTLKAST